MSARRRVGGILAAWAAVLSGLQLWRGDGRKTAPKPRQTATGGVMAFIPSEEYPITATPAPAPTTTRTSGGGDVSGLLALIRKAEAGPRGYDAYSGLIKTAQRPPKPPTQMTVGEVLDWQARIDRYQLSEAVGAYQIMEDTLRGLVNRGIAKRSERFSPAVQDRLAIALMREKGLDAFLAGRKSLASFALGLAKTWAGFPVLSATQGAQRYVLPGESYYAALAGNAATISTTEFKAALERAMA